MDSPNSSEINFPTYFLVCIHYFYILAIILENEILSPVVPFLIADHILYFLVYSWRLCITATCVQHKHVTLLHTHTNVAVHLHVLQGIQCR
jgi:hypothetical protein